MEVVEMPNYIDTEWRCDKWSEDACVFAREKLYLEEFAPVSSADLLKVIGKPEEVIHIPGNILLNEGILMILNVMIAGVSNQTAGNRWNNADSFIGVGDTLTAEAATQTELLGAAAATNRFYKAMNATFPVKPGSNGAQSVDWQSDFATSEANFVWNEWTIASLATTASGAGFLTGTTNLNRKVASLGTKTTGTWTLTGTVTIS
jgi:hypothetical protein